MKNAQKLLLGGLLALTLSTPAIGQDRDNQNRIFDNAYFEKFSPRTALDMLGRIPGFQLNRVDNKRGLGNGGANVIINGARISGKTDPRDQLSRIIASSVVRVEIVDGTSLDIPGLSGQVANVITAPQKFSGTWQWRGQARRDLQDKFLDGEITISGQTGDLSYSAKLDLDSFRKGNLGPEKLFTPDGTIFETRDEVGQFYGEKPSISSNLTWKPKEGHVVNLNAQYELFNFNGGEISKRTAVTTRGETKETRFSRAEDEWNAEIGGDYEFPAGPTHLNGKLKVIGYYRTEHSPTVSRFDVIDPVLGQTEGSRFFRIADEAETIARTEYSWSNTKGKDWQFSVEGAYNYLDIASNLLTLNTATGNFEEQDLVGATSRVEEKRAESTLTHSRSLSPKWDLQISGGGEFSEISQTGPTGKIREFIRPKGFISTTYKPDDTLSIRAKLERKVGQLDFFDFISSVSLQDDFDTDENENLVPEQAWFGEIEFDKKIRNGVTVKARFYGELISDLVDRIPIIRLDGSIGDAVGNIDSAKQYGLEINSTIKGDPFGYKGMQLDLQLQLQNSSVDDPLTLVSRRLNRDQISYWSVDFRHDIPDTNWAWGVFIDQEIESSTFRLSTINTAKFKGPFGSVFLEHKDVFGMKVKAQASNLFSATDDFRREIFTDRRDIGVLDFTESNSRTFGVIGRLTVSGSF